MTSLELEDKSTIKHLDRDPNLFFNQMTIIYGPSKSGKSTLLFDIMHLLKDNIAHVFVIAPTNYANGAYNDYVAPQCIISGNDVGETVGFLNKFITRQIALTNIYNKVNDLKMLEKVFAKLIDTEQISRVNFINSRSESAINKVEESQKLNLLEKRNQKKRIEEIRDKSLKEIYKSSIARFKDYLTNNCQLSEDEQIIVKWLNICPFALLILDDCASRFKTWIKADASVLKQIFYEGRQYLISTIILSQHDKEFASELRGNAMCSIFANSQSATVNFSRASNGFSPDIKKQANMCIKAVFNATAKDGKSYKKLVYSNNLDEPFHIFEAELRPTFKMGGKIYWDIAEKIKESSKNSEKSNPLLLKYR